MYIICYFLLSVKLKLLNRANYMKLNCFHWLNKSSIYYSDPVCGCFHHICEFKQILLELWNIKSSISAHWISAFLTLKRQGMNFFLKCKTNVIGYLVSIGREKLAIVSYQYQQKGIHIVHLYYCNLSAKCNVNCPRWKWSIMSDKCLYRGMKRPLLNKGIGWHE